MCNRRREGLRDREMTVSTPRSSRLASVANARRRQRKERMSSGSPNATKMSGSDSPSFTSPRVEGYDKMSSPRMAGNNKLSGIVEKEAAGPSTRDAGAETETAQTIDIMPSTGSTNQENINQSNTLNTLPTDDESISTWSQAQSTVSGCTDDSFFAQNQNKVPTNKRRPVNITVVTEEILSPRTILSPKQQNGNVSFRGMASPQRILTPRTPSTPKMSGGNALSKGDPRSMMKLVDELTQERDRLRSDCNLYKQKLHKATEDKMAVVQEKDDQITELMKSVGNLTVLIDEVDENCGKELMEVNHNSSWDGKTTKELQKELSSTVCQLNQLRVSYEKLKQASAHGRQTIKEKVQSSTIDAGKNKSSVEKLEKELSQVTSEFEECVGELEKALSKEKVSSY